jgi:hypothetical protein
MSNFMDKAFAIRPDIDGEENRHFEATSSIGHDTLDPVLNPRLLPIPTIGSTLTHADPPNAQSGVSLGFREFAPHDAVTVDHPDDHPRYEASCSQ